MRNFEKKRLMIFHFFLIILFGFMLLKIDVYAQNEKSSIGTTITGTSTGGTAVTSMYYADLPDDWIGKRQVYSLDSNQKFASEKDFFVANFTDDRIENLEKSIILGYALLDTPLPTTGNEVSDKEIKTWIEQMAIWVTYAKLSGEPLADDIRHALFVNGDINGEYLEIKNLTTSTGHDFSDLNVDFNGYVKFMVENAEIFDGGITPKKMAKVTVDGTPKIEGDYYISGPIKVSLLLTQNPVEYHYYIKDFSLEITNDVKEAIIVDENGTEIKNTDKLTDINKLYYVKVPVSSLTKSENFVTLKTIICDSSDNEHFKTSFLYTTVDNNYSIVKEGTIYPFKYTDSLKITFDVKEEPTVVEIPNTNMKVPVIICIIGMLVMSIGILIIFSITNHKATNR